MNTKKIAALSLIGALALTTLSGCGKKEEATTLKVGATPAPHAEILEIVKDALAQEGIALEIVEFTDYRTPNDSTEDGSIDANYFQHITYMNNYNEENGTHLVSVGAIHYEPIGLYPSKTTALADLPDNAAIGIPNDTTNEARALLLLEQEGLITLKEGAGINATKLDIVDNPKNLTITEMEAASLPSHLADFDLAVINGNYAIDADMTIEDALAVEAADGIAAEAYANVIAVKEGSEDNEAVKALVKALQSEEVRTFMEEHYGKSVVPLF